MACGAYRVRRLPRSSDQRWELQIMRRRPGWEQEHATSTHRSIRAAVVRAETHERHRLRNLSLQINLAASLVAAIAGLTVIVYLWTSIIGLVAWIGLFALAVRFLANALDVLDASKPDRSARGVDRHAAIQRWVRVDSLVPPLRTPSSHTASAEESSIRMLDPVE